MIVGRSYGRCTCLISVPEENKGLLFPMFGILLSASFENKLFCKTLFAIAFVHPPVGSHLKSLFRPPVNTPVQSCELALLHYSTHNINLTKSTTQGYHHHHQPHLVTSLRRRRQERVRRTTLKKDRGIGIPLPSNSTLKKSIKTSEILYLLSLLLKYWVLGEKD